MTTPRRTDDTLSRRFSARLMGGTRLMAAGLLLAVAAAAVSFSGVDAVGGVSTRNIAGGLAGVAAIAMAAAVVIQLTTTAKVRRELLDPADSMNSRLRKMIIAGVSDIKPLNADAASELRDIWSNYQKLAIALDRARTHAQAALDTSQARNQTALNAAMQAEAEKEKGETDPLTKLFNRRRMDADLQRDADSVIEGGGGSFAFVMVDVDHFKSFNDNYGHQKGDEILQGLAVILKESVRGLDTAYRYGGEEFSLILRQINPPAAYEVVERIRAKVEAVFAATDTPMTASFGVSLVPQCANSAASVIAAADAALYESKEGGRNRVTLAPPVSMGSAPAAAAPPVVAPAPAHEA